MNKKELISAIFKDTDKKIMKNSIELVVDSFIDMVSDSLHNGEEVVLLNFGCWRLGSRKATTGRNPQTGKPIKIPAKTVVKFTPSQAMKDSVKKLKLKVPKILKSKREKELKRAKK